MNELDAEMANARSDPGIELVGRRLGFGPEDGVATSDIGQHGMPAAVSIPQRHGVCFAGMAAVGMVRSFRQVPAKDTVLGMKNGQVMKYDDFDRTRIDGSRDFLDLPGIQIVGRGDPGDSQIEIGAKRDGICRVQTEIAMHFRQAAVAVPEVCDQVMEQAARANQDRAIQ